MLQETSYTDEQLYTIMCEAEENGAYVALIRGNLCRTLEDFYKEISAAMRFPSYFGWNWAALDDCIRDLAWLRFSSLLIVIDDFDRIFRRELRPGKYKELLTRESQILPRVSTFLAPRAKTPRRGTLRG